MLPGSFWETKGSMCLDLLTWSNSKQLKRVPTVGRGSRNHLGWGLCLNIHSASIPPCSYHNVWKNATCSNSVLPFCNYRCIHKLTESSVAVTQHTLHFQTIYSPFIARRIACIQPKLFYQTGQRRCLAAGSRRITAQT